MCRDEPVHALHRDDRVLSFPSNGPAIDLCLDNLMLDLRHDWLELKLHTTTRQEGQVLSLHSDGPEIDLRMDNLMLKLRQNWLELKLCTTAHRDGQVISLHSDRRIILVLHFLFLLPLLIIMY